MNVKVIELDAAKMCQSPQDWTDYIYYIITAEVLLLVGKINFSAIRGCVPILHLIILKF